MKTLFMDANTLKSRHAHVLARVAIESATKLAWMLAPKGAPGAREAPNGSSCARHRGQPEGARRDAACVRLVLHSAGLVCRLEEVQDALVDDLVLAD
jgi:hypothetical protein